MARRFKNNPIKTWKLSYPRQSLVASDFILSLFERAVAFWTIYIHQRNELSINTSQLHSLPKYSLTESSLKTINPFLLIYIVSIVLTTYEAASNNPQFAYPLQDTT